MLFYHFTSLGHLPVILSTGGLWRGEVLVDDGSESLRGTWLTTDPDPRHHGLSGSAVNKRAVRITIDMPLDMDGLEHWMTFTEGRLDPYLIGKLVKTGGGSAKADTWYVFRDQIPPSDFKAIEFQRTDGSYAVASPEKIAALAPHRGLHEAVVEDFAELRSRALAAE